MCRAHLLFNQDPEEFLGQGKPSRAGVPQPFHGFVSEEVRSARGAPRLIVIGGLAGSGKTELLHALRELGEQILDLEDLAVHSGSAFGHLGRPAQPSHERFQARVAAAMHAADRTRPVWVEDEGPFLGSVGLPRHLQEAIATAPVLELVVPRAERVERLRATYGGHPADELVTALKRISPRLGRSASARVLEAVQAGHMRAAIETLLPYYDDSYTHRVAAYCRPRTTIGFRSALTDGRSPHGTQRRRALIAIRQALTQQW